MTRLEDRQTLVHLIAEMRGNGARQAPPCTLAGSDGLTRGDRRPDAIRPAPSHALTDEERERIVAVANDHARQPRTSPPDRGTSGVGM
jgi:putative transposase